MPKFVFYHQVLEVSQNSISSVKQFKS